MNIVRILVLAFCLIVVFLSGWTLAGVAKSLSLLKPQLAAQAELLEEIENEESTLSENWLALDSKQRMERADYDGPEAVDASYDTQMAFAALNQTKTIRQELETNFEKLKTQQRSTASWITPLIVLALIHLIIFVGLLPKRMAKTNPK